jgi:hypothetical protein
MKRMAARYLPLIALLAQPIFTAPTDSSPYDDTYPHPANGICTDYTIKEEVTWTKYKWAQGQPKDDYELGAITIGVQLLDTDFELFSGKENATDTYELRGTFCTPATQKDGKETTVLLATHGGGFDSRLVLPSSVNESWY